ncbi:threonine--tRNA ligase [Paradevosia shaoguanensis]|uniref:Threonine--tRNA ligase n=1 Tax=Paradevosia shaoguanensis TaxID=1335043 RepID=A0AA41QMA7_9HYPH|nr:threonine--tRNA ligase [Paradevosia shaoguanensis]MCF1743018.1 threonine--tRNA ligase [Paradevosia shaoguanensis]MCI0127501.1 threonine--tRNA ligase [Paradevosia shaoguanensis]
MSIKVTFPDGAVREFPRGTTGTTVVEDISKSLAKKTVAMRWNGVLSDLSDALEEDGKIEFVTRDQPAALELIRHDAAHVLAEAVQELWPSTQVTIGPVIENGFYYDFARDVPFGEDDLRAIEKKMSEIIERGAAFTKEIWTRDEAKKVFAAKGENFKVELVDAIPADQNIKIYKQGQWFDLCRGPHMRTTKDVGQAFKLTKVAGAYWRGDSNNPVLSRIYGTAFATKEELDAYLHMMEEAEKRDHRKLGRELDLFHLQEEAQGSVFWHPKGFTIYNQMEAYIRRRLNGSGYVEVKTPQLMSSKFWEASGHWGKYRENMFVVPDEVPGTEEEGPVLSGKSDLMALKPMNCPAHIQIFNQGIKSYRDLPIRMAEFGCCHRNEAHGALHGLMRVRQMTQDDAHIFCREDQIQAETEHFVHLLYSVYKDMGFDQIVIKLATRPEKFGGTIERWDAAEKALGDALRATGYDFEIAEGEGAFYAPKLEFHLKDAIGRSWQCGTLQLDYVLPERLEASYVAEDGSRQRPVMLHRAILGSLERFIGMMLESYAGKLPTWLAPTQVVVATIVSEADEYAAKLVKQLKAAGIRAELDTRNEKINYKVREHSMQKVPLMFVVGKREAEEGTVSVRRLGTEGQKVVPSMDAIVELMAEVQPPDLKRAAA